MAHDDLRHAVQRVNSALGQTGLVALTWGNASGVDRSAGVMAIKPSGVDYAALTPDDIVVLSIESGEVIEGRLRPSSDAPTHLHLYREFLDIGGVVHTHSSHAVSFAQAELDLPCLGTTHADHFHGPVPVTRRLREDEIAEAYERNTGALIVECFRDRGIDPNAVPGVLVAGHGPFAWGPTPEKALENAIVLEEVARMALNTRILNAASTSIDKALLDKHYERKHGSSAYYGQQ